MGTIIIGWCYHQIQLFVGTQKKRFSTSLIPPQNLMFLLSFLKNFDDCKNIQ